MKTLQITILILLFFSSCNYRPFPKEKYEIGENYRNLINSYSLGDTLIFKSSQNKIDSFVISGIDSAINDRNGYFINAANGKSISLTYKQIPIDKWQYTWLEVKGDGKEHPHSEDGTFISIAKNYYFSIYPE